MIDRLVNLMFFGVHVHIKGESWQNLGNPLHNFV